MGHRISVNSSPRAPGIFPRCNRFSLCIWTHKASSEKYLSELVLAGFFHKPACLLILSQLSSRPSRNLIPVLGVGVGVRLFMRKKVREAEASVDFT